jgi:hypothetical protein
MIGESIDVSKVTAQLKQQTSEYLSGLHHASGIEQVERSLV